MKSSGLKGHLVLILILLVSGCTSDDSDDLLDDLIDAPGSLIATVNGSNFEADVIEVDLQNGSNNSFTLSIAAVKVTVNTNAGAEGIGLAFLGSNFNSIEAGDVFTSNNINQLFAGGYSSQTNNINASSEDQGFLATCTITAIDHGTGLISGTFSFDAFDEDINTAFEVRNGVFENIEYK